MGKLLQISIFLLISICCAEKIDDSIHYYLSFTSDAEKIKLSEPLIKSDTADADDFVRITTKNDEKFVCKLPKIEAETKKSLDYNGMTPDELLAVNLYNLEEKGCSYLMDVFWTYQVCHGRYVTQFHDDRTNPAGMNRMEFYLGNFDPDVSSKRPTSEIINPPVRRIESEDYPYHSVHYDKGTTCDLTGKPRTTDVIYICVQNENHKILSITEISSCHYEVVIMTHLLCQHPAYKPGGNKDHEIMCYNENAKDEEEAKPKALQNLDDFHSTTFKREYSINAEKPIEEQNIDTIELEKLKENELMDYVLVGEKRFKSKESLANNPAVLRHTVSRILSGVDCVVGGDGWWKFEFCYGLHVLQFHEEPNGKRDEILLGQFDENVHKAWVNENRGKKGAMVDGKHVVQLNHIYVKGDMCEETGAHRSVEVVLRCKMAEYSSLAFNVLLTEPKTCQYELIVESERFCEPMQYSDDYGLIHIAKQTTILEKGPPNGDGVITEEL